MTKKILNDNQASDSFLSLSGCFLIAMPTIDDLRFEKSVIYIYEHTQNGAKGLVINKPAPQTSFNELMDQLQIKIPPSQNYPTILLGGPDKFANGFILHSSEYKVDSTKSYGNLSLTSTQDILMDIAWQKGPEKYLIALGRATWVAGQLEEELLDNVWLTTPVSNDILFEIPYSDRWTSVFKKMGIESTFLSSECGKA